MTPTSQDSPEHTTHHRQAASGPPNIRSRIAKRSSNACARCRRQKIKCTGTYPCEACNKRKLSCIFDDHVQKVLVTRGYLASLQEQATQRGLGGGQNVFVEAQGNLTSTAITRQNELVLSRDWLDTRGLHSRPPDAPELQQQDPRSMRTESGPLGDCASEELPETTSLMNPLSTGPSTFMLSDTGRTFYLGHSSNWSFTRRILKMTHEHIHQAALPTAALMFDGQVYVLDWPRSGDLSRTSHSAPALPTMDYATHLVNIVKFHCSPLFHLFDDTVFMEALHAHYESKQKPEALVQQLWFIHFMLILAFGKALTSKPGKGNQPPGAGFFIHAMQLLPNITILWSEPVQATEILCCIALYLHCIEHRGSAHNYIGQAVRLAMTHGLHTDLSSHQVEFPLISRCRKLWWTILVLDRQMTYLSGLPQSVRDEDVTAPLPDFEGDIFRTSAFAMRTKLSHFIATIDRNIYKPDERLSSNFLLRTKDTLASMAKLPDELRQQFPLDLDNNESGTPRISAHIHLLFHQCIILATRPILFCLYKIRLETPHSYTRIFDSSPSVQSLLRMCLDSSQHVVSILECLQREDLIETFLSYDLEALSISMTNLLVAPVLYQGDGSNWASWRHRAFSILDEIAQSGNLIAQCHESELKRLQQMIEILTGVSERTPESPRHAPVSTTVTEPPAGAGFSDPEAILPSPITEDVLDGNYTGAGFSTSQIMDMVNSIDTEHSEWMTEAFFEYT